MTTPEKDPNPILIDVPMPIRTPRLLLRPVRTGDGPAMTECKRETWDELTQWMPWTKEGPGTPEKDEAACREGEANFILRTNLWILGEERATGRVVIWTGLHRFDWQLRRFEIGYYVRKSAQGLGYATESTNALTRFAFNALAARRVEIFHADGNDRSGNVARKLGFNKEAVCKNAIRLPDGHVVDSHDYVRIDAAGLPPLDVTWGPP